jgi:hypothetical protein
MKPKPAEHKSAGLPALQADKQVNASETGELT